MSKTSKTIGLLFGIALLSRITGLGELSKNFDAKVIFSIKFSFFITKDISDLLPASHFMTVFLEHSRSADGNPKVADYSEGALRITAVIPSKDQKTLPSPLCVERNGKVIKISTLQPSGYPENDWNGTGVLFYGPFASVSDCNSFNAVFLEKIRKPLRYPPPPSFSLYQ